MAWAKHTTLNTPRERDRMAYPAFAPYNFVPLPEKIVPAETLPDHDSYQGNSGWITCALTTLSPLYIRGLLSSNDFSSFGDKEFHTLDGDQKKRRAEFYKIGNRVGIPGSSLRGVLRAMIEIAGYGKLDKIADKKMIFRAVGDSTSLGTYYRDRVLGKNKATPPNNDFEYPSPNLLGGYLEKTKDGGWSIRPASTQFNESFIHVEYADAKSIGTRHSWASSNPHNRFHYQETHVVYVRPEGRRHTNRGFRGRGNLSLNVAVASVVAKNPAPGLVKATLVVSGDMGAGGNHSKHWHCAIYEPNKNAQPIPIPHEMWELYVEDRDVKRGISTRELKKDGDALFYLLDSKGQLIFFGPTQMFRLPFGKSLRDFVPQDLRLENTVDIAEGMFGYVKSNQKPYGKSRAYAGRVFVCDAYTDQEAPSVLESEVKTLAILGTPKPSTFQHYLVQPDAAANDRRNLYHYASQTPNETVLRGHKLYWHREGKYEYEKPCRASQEQDSDPQKQLTSIRPVKTGTTFVFKVRFENLSDAELGALLWALDLPEGCAHKLGMGKPLGMGSVRVDVKELHCQNRIERYSSLLKDSGWELGETTSKGIEAYKKDFEDYVLQKMDQGERGRAAHLSQVPRIHELLVMLSFKDKPAWGKTQYMEIEREGKGNEYKERPVLPLPSVVANKKLSIRIQENQANFASEKGRASISASTAINSPQQ